MKRFKSGFTPLRLVLGVVCIETNTSLASYFIKPNLSSLRLSVIFCLFSLYPTRPISNYLPLSIYLFHSMFHNVKKEVIMKHRLLFKLKCNNTKSTLMCKSSKKTFKCAFFFETKGLLCVYMFLEKLCCHSLGLGCKRV